MGRYSRVWNCDNCGSREETMDWPAVFLCERCDDQTKVRCAVCTGPTSVTRRVLHRARRRVVVHPGCVMVDPVHVVRSLGVPPEGVE